MNVCSFVTMGCALSGICQYGKEKTSDDFFRYQEHVFETNFKCPAPLVRRSQPTLPSDVSFQYVSDKNDMNDSIEYDDS